MVGTLLLPYARTLGDVGEEELRQEGVWGGVVELLGHLSQSS